MNRVLVGSEYTCVEKCLPLTYYSKELETTRNRKPIHKANLKILRALNWRI